MIRRATLIAWVAPGLFVVRGSASIPTVTRRWSKRAHADAPAAPELTPDEARRLDEELRRLG